MKKLDNVIYDCLTYDSYQKRLKDIYRNEKLRKMGLHQIVLPKTNYGYNLDAFSIGYGDKEIFLVGGTHGSEIISVDMVLQLVNNLPLMKEFNPNEYKIICMPLQNPEAFDITTSNLKRRNAHNFEKLSYEYYLSYKIDNLVNSILIDINKCINDNMNKPANYFLTKLKEVINNNKSFDTLISGDIMPAFGLFRQLFMRIGEVKSNEEIKYYVRIICARLIKKYYHKDEKFCFIMSQLDNAIKDGGIIKTHEFKKLYMNMFKENNNKKLLSSTLAQDVSIYEIMYNHPDGSRIIYDANGNGVNLNFNTRVLYDKQVNNEDIYGWGIKNNIRRYTPGPLGTTTNSYVFDYEIENKALYMLLEESYRKGKYCMTLLYHATGGIMYYKPAESITNSRDYRKYNMINENIAYNYNSKANYLMKDTCSDDCYGDLLRSKFPGVILIDISKMGGNPIGPYGDVNNIYRTINENIEGFKRVLKK